MAPLVQAELDRRFPQRVKLRATDPQGLAEAWDMIEDVWRATIGRARALPEPLLVERVDGEWSFTETLRHLVLATDCWLLRMIRQVPWPYHRWGLPPSFMTDPAGLGVDPTASPSLAEVLQVRRERMQAVKQTIAALTPGHPTEPHTALKCLHVILDEEWEHNRYANRDLDVLAARPR